MSLTPASTRASAVAAAVALALVCLGPRSARADEPAPPKYWVDFEAGRVELEPDVDRLKLSDGVAIRVDRYQLTSKKLTLERTPHGVVVDGEGRVSFCRCKDPPITFGFRRAIVAPPTDLFVKEPTVRVGGVPVFWMPLLWLRAPDRLGLLAPRVAWRGDDGLLAGAGVHVPLGGGRGRALAGWDVFASGYLKGGVDVESSLSTASSSTRVRFDYLKQSLFAVDAHGSTSGPHSAVLAWKLDALRGARGRSGTLELEPAARRFDRATAAALTAGDGFVGAFAVDAVSRRGGAFDTVDAVGPGLHAGFGSGLGAGSSVDTGLELDSLREGEHLTTTTLAHRADIEASAAFGPLLGVVDVGDRAFSRSTEQGGSGIALGGGRAVLSLPLERRFGRGLAAVAHRVEPFVAVGGRIVGERSEPGAPLELYAADEERRSATAEAGVSTALGSFAKRWGSSLTLRGAAVGDPASPDSVVAARLSADAPVVAARVEGAADPEDPHAAVTSARLRLGPRDGLHLTGHAEARRDREPLSARALWADSWTAPRIGWLLEPGLGAGGELGIPWTHELATAVFAEADVDHERLLALGGALGYRHGCGCLATRAWIGHRVGRDGIDAIVTLDLLP